MGPCLAQVGFNALGWAVAQSGASPDPCSVNTTSESAEPPLLGVSTAQPACLRAVQQKHQQQKRGTTTSPRNYDDSLPGVDGDEKSGAAQEWDQMTMSTPYEVLAAQDGVFRLREPGNQSG